MSDYDAFGRQRDEAGLGDLGWGTTDDPGSTTNPEPASDTGFSTPTEFTTVPTGPPPVRRRRRGSPFVWLVQLMVLGGIAAGIYFAVDAGNDAANSVRDAFGTFDDLATGNANVDRGDDRVPGQVEARKLFTPEGLRSAVKVMEREVPGKLTTFSIRRDRINATVVSGGKQSVVNFQADAEVPQVLSASTAGSTITSFSYEELNYDAPARLIRASNARVDRSEADVDYLVAQKFSGTMQWGVYYEGGSPITQGDSQGRFLRRIS